MRRSLGETETRRATRSTRAIRATVANAPTPGIRDRPTTRKSKKFQPSRRNLPSRKPWDAMRIASSPTKNARTTAWAVENSRRLAAASGWEVSSPTRTALTTITATTEA
jgi:hypothetical protein